jgi:hypothetical protein
VESGRAALGCGGRVLLALICAILSASLIVEGSLGDRIAAWGVASGVTVYAAVAAILRGRVRYFPSFACGVAGACVITTMAFLVNWNGVDALLDVLASAAGVSIPYSAVMGAVAPLVQSLFVARSSAGAEGAKPNEIP